MLIVPDLFVNLVKFFRLMLDRLRRGTASLCLPFKAATFAGLNSKQCHVKSPGWDACGKGIAVLTPLCAAD